MNRVGVFVDVQNVYYTTRERFGRQFNYRELWRRLQDLGEIVVANAYATDRGDANQGKFQSALRHIGFDVKLKPFIQRSDGSAKGDWDVGITIDAMTAAPQIDTAVLISGDGDFDLLLRHLRDTHGVRSIVFGVSGLTAQSLITAADVFNATDESLLL